MKKWNDFIKDFSPIHLTIRFTQVLRRIFDHTVRVCLFKRVWFRTMIVTSTQTQGSTYFYRLQYESWEPMVKKVNGLQKTLQISSLICSCEVNQWFSWHNSWNNATLLCQSYSVIINDSFVISHELRFLAFQNRELKTTLKKFFHKLRINYLSVNQRFYIV